MYIVNCLFFTREELLTITQLNQYSCSFRCNKFQDKINFNCKDHNNAISPNGKVRLCLKHGCCLNTDLMDTAEIRCLRPDTVFCGSAVHLNKTTKCRQF